MNVEIGNEAAQLPDKEQINGIFLAVRIIFMRRIQIPIRIKKRKVDSNLQ